MQLFQLKKTTKFGVCDAMRCTENTYTTLPGDIWGMPGSLVDLCIKHLSFAEDYTRKQNGSPVPDGANVAGSTQMLLRAPLEPEAVKLIGFATAAALNEWLARVIEVRKLLEESLDEGKGVLEEAKELKIGGQADLSILAEVAQEAKSRLKLVVALEKEISGPVGTALARLRELCKPAKQTWTDAEHVLRAHLEAVALKQAQTNREAQAEAARLAAEGADPREALAKQTHTSNLTGVSLKLKWKAVVKDVTKLPDEFVIKLPNEKKLKEHCATAEGDEPPAPVAGVEFVRDVDSRIQAAKS